MCRFGRENIKGLRKKTRSVIKSVIRFCFVLRVIAIVYSNTIVSSMTRAVCVSI